MSKRRNRHGRKATNEWVARAADQRAAQPRSEQEIEHKIEETRLKAEKVKLVFLFLQNVWPWLEKLWSMLSSAG